MQYRHEWKTEISELDVRLLRQRLSAVMRRDPHALPKGDYLIRSLYFDNDRDAALREKLDGVSVRAKFRIRLYNGDTSLIRLEKKSKRDGLGCKLSAPLTREETERLLRGETGWMAESGYPVVRELREKMLHGGYRPRTIVEYTREPFVYAPGNVRVTLDHHIRTGMCGTDLLNPSCLTVPAGNMCILEVKYDQFLPDVVRDAVQLGNRRVEAFSKYAACRIFG